MSDFASPMLRRWELGNALRRIREERGMTIADVTIAMKERYGSSFSPTKLSRMETAKRGVIPRDVHDLCLLYDLPEADREHLVNLAKSARGSEPAVMDEQARGYLWYATLEEVASGIREYTGMFVPGLLQTQGYARVVEDLQFVAPDYYSPRLGLDDIPENADDRVRLRLKRQELLEGDDPTFLHVVIDEGVLRRQLPDANVMIEQLDHLLEMSEHPNIRIQVVPFEVGLYPGAECSHWSILDFPEGDNQPPTTVYAEAVTGLQVIDRDADTARMISAFDTLAQLALDTSASRGLITEARQARRS
jgi:transcriptional regulator with XRE-family HTH domain